MKRTLCITMAVLLLFAFGACASAEKSIVGTWKSQKTVLGVVTETTYIFNEDGTGSKSTVFTTDFTYSFSDDKLLITTSTLGIKSTDEYEFSFDGDKLILKDGEDIIELNKVG